MQPRMHMILLVPKQRATQERATLASSATTLTKDRRSAVRPVLLVPVPVLLVPVCRFSRLFSSWIASNMAFSLAVSCWDWKMPGSFSTADIISEPQLSINAFVSVEGRLQRSYPLLARHSIVGTMFKKSKGFIWFTASFMSTSERHSFFPGRFLGLAWTHATRTATKRMRVVKYIFILQFSWRLVELRLRWSKYVRSVRFVVSFYTLQGRLLLLIQTAFPDRMGTAHLPWCVVFAKPRNVIRGSLLHHLSIAHLPVSFLEGMPVILIGLAKGMECKMYSQPDQRNNTVLLVCLARSKERKSLSIHSLSFRKCEWHWRVKACSMELR